METKTTVLTLTRAARQEHFPEAELVRVEVIDGSVRFVLDDGETLDFDRRELSTAVAA